MIPMSTFANSILTQINVIFNGINVQVDGSSVDVNSILYNGTTYLPMRKVAELVGKDVDWNNDTKTANIIEKKEEIKNGDNMSNETYVDKNSIVIKTENGIICDGIEYYTPVYINDLLYKPHPYYWIRYNAEETKLYLPKHISSVGIEIEKVLIDNIPYIIYSNSTYISKEYYETTILPMIIDDIK